MNGNYEVEVAGENIVYGPLVQRSRFTEEQWRAINHEMVKRNFEEEYEKYKDDELVITVIADRIDLSERYEALLELLPQSTYSKAGTHPVWVADAVEENILIKDITKDDVEMFINDSEDIDDLKQLLKEYFSIREESE